MVTPGGRTLPAYLAAQELLKFLKNQQLGAQECCARRSAGASRFRQIRRQSAATSAPEVERLEAFARRPICSLSAMMSVGPVREV
jgi:hypothetical protein